MEEAGHSLAQDRNCRVNYPHTCEIQSLNKWGKDFSTTDKYYDITGYNNGMYIYRPEDGLRVPQRRSFLTPEYYDSGCYNWYCNRKEECPQGTLSGPTEQENQMFDYMFSSTDMFDSNSCLSQCAGIKGTGASSTCGYLVPEGSDQFLWQIEAEKKGNVGSCNMAQGYN
jgi:hypothetical protein